VVNPPLVGMLLGVANRYIIGYHASISTELIGTLQVVNLPLGGVYLGRHTPTMCVRLLCTFLAGGESAAGGCIPGAGSRADAAWRPALPAGDGHGRQLRRSHAPQVTWGPNLVQMSSPKQSGPVPIKWTIAAAAHPGPSITSATSPQGKASRPGPFAPTLLPNCTMPLYCCQGAHCHVDASLCFA